MYLAAGLGQLRVKATAFTVPTLTDLSVEDADEVVVSLESTAALTGLHKTLPVQTTQARKLLFIQNGFDREKKYNGTNFRDAFTLAPARAPTVETVGPDTRLELGKPDALAVDDNYVYVKDESGGDGENRILRLSHDGELIDFHDETNTDIPVGSGGYRIGEGISWMLIEGAYLYVTDADNDRVIYFNISNFTYQGTFGATGTGNGQFDFPSGITSDATYLYVVDYGNDRITQWTISGHTWNSNFGSTGSGTDQFYGPWGIWCDRTTPCLWIGDADVNERIVITDKMPSGSAWTTVATSGAAIWDIKMDPTDAEAFIAYSIGEIRRYSTNGTSAPTLDVTILSFGTDDEDWWYPRHCYWHSGYIWFSDWKNIVIKKCNQTDLTFVSKIVDTVDIITYGERQYAYSYIDEDGVESALSPADDGAHPEGAPNTDVTGFYSADPKVAYVRIYASYFDAFGDFYRLETFANNPAGTTWTKTDTSADSALGSTFPALLKRPAIQGLPTTRRVACVWRDMMWRAGGIFQPDYSAGTVTFDAAWSATRGLWKGTITTGHASANWVGRYISEQSAPDDKYQIVDVDETNNYIWLSVEFEGTVSSPVAYTITDERDFSVAEYSQPGYYEDLPASRLLPVGEGDSDEIVAMYPMGERLFIFKRHSIWVVTGSGPSSFVVRRVTRSTGAQSPQSLIELPLAGNSPILAFWSYPTVYAMSQQGSEPQAMSSFMSPLTAGVSEGASPRCAVLFDREREVLTFSMGTEADPANHDNFTLETYGLRWSRDVGLRISCAGEMSNRFGKRVPFFVDEFGCLWQYGIGATEGNPGNDLSGDVTAWETDTLKVTCNLSTFDLDLEGCPVFLINELGEFSRNYIVSSTAHDLFLAWEPPTTLTTDYSLIIAGIEHVFETGEVDAGTQEVEKKFEDLWIDYVEGTATLKVEAATGEDALELVDEFEMDGAAVEHFPLSGASIGLRGKTIRFRLSTVDPGEEWVVRGYIFRVSHRSERAR